MYSGSPLSLYIHVPFCVKKCEYCDFYSIPYESGQEDGYISVLLQEMAAAPEALKQRPVLSVYIGGGTPSILSDRGISNILNGVGKNFSLGNACEISLEANPAGIDPSRLDHWADEGINRISVGIQSLSDEELRLLGRAHDRKTALQSLNALAKSRLANFSVDILFGIPGQNMAGLEETLIGVLEWSPPHLSIYGLTAERRTPLYGRIQRDDLSMPLISHYNKMFERTHAYLNEKGYSHYEISNYAKNESWSTHNLHYWKRGEYLGFGPGAHSFINEIRWSNVRDHDEYLARIKRGGSPILSQETISMKQRSNEVIMLGLRTAGGVRLSDLENWDRNPLSDRKNEVSKMTEDKLICVENGKIQLTLQGWMVSDEVIAMLME